MRGTLPTSLGPLDEQTEGFMLTGVPLVMGDHPKRQLAKAQANLGKVGRALRALHPSYLLVLQVVLVFVVPTLDDIYEAMPPHPQRLRNV